ncbi:YhfC family glutamic-type intramembrane protease [Paenibacillus cremeus]|uniref:YhfC family intramembrane metalloprotease n=1 Tax=Paenibacillus cremeus TaxID=2163881 RepID=A0A559K8M7_9BACL|nr:YhfC family glutamic-type intramembrane protease [Paenibacillus cremeus]TVY08484.1 YhfC family intramembrane metalloprotease [Paenibacillus cremeus]
MTQNLVDGREATHIQFEKAAHKAKYFLPLYLLVPVLYAVAFYFSGGAMEWNAFGLGALGWVIALFLRGPLSAIVMKMKLSQEKTTAIIVGSSGVLEESVRLVVLMVTSTAFSWSLSVGQGWAAVEVLFTMVNIIVILSLAHRTDEKAVQAKEMLRMQGQLNTSPLWGVIERIFASALHIGFTLLVAHYPWLVVLFIPLHSIVNLTALKLAKKSIVQTELMIAIVGTAILVLGLTI